MNTLTKTFLTLFALNVGALLLVSILWKNKDTRFTSFFFAGTYIYRDLSKFIRKERTRAYLALSYSGLILFVLVVLSIILLGVNK
jgi:hypothetical protein